jgi:uroporphyrinogen-III decarboxylase
VQGALFLAMDHPKEFGRLFDQITETDIARTELAAQMPGIGLLVERGWYSSTEFWSPRLLDTYLFPHIAKLSKIAHSHGKQFGYVMTTGIHILGERLARAGVDVLYFLDPFKDQITLERALEWLTKDMTLVGGISSLQLSDPRKQIEENVQHAMEVLGKSNRFILQPVDSLFPDTPWDSMEALIDTWKKNI